MLDPDAIYFPEAEIMPPLAMAFILDDNRTGERG
jgi:hypothetical protein